MAGVNGTVARIARELLAEVCDLAMRANDLERETAALVPVAPALLALQ